MSDATQNVIWRLTIDPTNLGEVERRLAALQRQQREVESFSGSDPNQFATAANRRTRAMEAETAAIDRQTRALNALASARQRAMGAGGVPTTAIPSLVPSTVPAGPGVAPSRIPGVGPGSAPGSGSVPWTIPESRFPNRPPTSPVLPPSVPSPVRPPATGAAGPAIPHNAGWGLRRAIEGWHPGLRPQYNDPTMPFGGAHPMWTRRGDQLDALRRRIEGRYQQPGFDAVYQQTLGGLLPNSMRNYSPLPPWGGPRGGFNGQSSYGSVSDAALRHANQQGGQMFGMAPWRAMSVYSNLGTALAGGAMAFDQNLAPMTRISGGIAAGVNAADAFYTMGGIQGLRSMAGSTLGRASMVAAPVALGLEGARRYYQGEADYQGQIGAQYDHRFAMKNMYRDQQTAIGEMRQGHRERMRSLYENHRDRTFAGYSGRMSRRYAYDNQIASTYADPTERIQSLQGLLGNVNSEIGRIDRQGSQMEERLKEADPDDRGRLQRKLAAMHDRSRVAREQAAGIWGQLTGTASDAASRLSQIDERLADMSPLDRASPQGSRLRDQLTKEREKLQRTLEAAGAGGLSAEEIAQRGGAQQRGLLGVAARDAAAADRQNISAEWSETAKKESQEFVDQLREIKDDFFKQLQELARQAPPTPERTGVNAMGNDASDFVNNYVPMVH